MVHEETSPTNVEHDYRKIGHQGQNIMNLQASPPHESITTKGAIFREVAADMKDMKKSSPTSSCRSIIKTF